MELLLLVVPVLVLVVVFFFLFVEALTAVDHPPSWTKVPKVPFLDRRAASNRVPVVLVLVLVVVVVVIRGGVQA